MTAGEKAIGATVGTLIILASAYLFLHFSALAAIDKSYSAYNWLCAFGLIPGFFTLYYFAFIPYKPDSSQNNTANN